MGHGIAQVAAQSGFQIVAVETKKEALDAGMARLDSLSPFMMRINNYY